MRESIQPGCKEPTGNKRFICSWYTSCWAFICTAGQSQSMPPRVACFVVLGFFNEWGKLKGYALTGSGCSGCGTSLELVRNPGVQHQPFCSIDLLLLPCASCQRGCHLYWGTYRLPKHFSPLILSNSHNFAQVPVATSLLFRLSNELAWLFRRLHPNSVALGSSQKASKFLRKFTDEFAKPSVTFFCVSVSTSAYPCHCWGWNLCQASQVSTFPSLYHPS